MKSFFKKMVVAVCLMVAMVANAEAQNSFAYQAVIRTAKGELVSNKEIAMQFSLIYDGKVVYCETQTPTTSQYGNVKVEVGNGRKVSGDFAAVPWSSMQVMMKIEADPNGGTDYIDLGTIQLQPAPYAMYATAAGMVNTVEAGEPKSDSNALFEVKDKDGNVVFAVYPDGVRVFVDDADSTAAKAMRTGFAVSGRRAAKEGGGANYFEVTADGTQVLVDEDTAAKAVRTGFAVAGRRAGAKDAPADLFTVGSTGTQVYIDEDATKAVRTGFAVAGRRAGAKDGLDNYLEINTDGIRVYIDNDEDSTKAIRTGFAVSGRRAAKGENSKFLEINADGTKVYVDDADKRDGKPISTGFAVSGRRGAAKGKGVKLFEVNSFGTQIYIDTEKDKAQRTGFAVSGRRAAKKGEVTNKYMVIDADGTRIYVDYEEAKAMRTGFAVSGRKAAKNGTPNTILKVDNAEGTRAYIDDIDGKAMQTGFAVSGRRAAKEGAPDLLRITSGSTTLAAASLALQDKETNKDLMSISSKNTSINTDDFSLSNHEDKDVLTTTGGNVEVKNDLVVMGDVAQAVAADTIEDILPVYLAVGPKIDTVLCADTASALEAPNGYMLLKIYGNGLFAPNQNVDVEGNNVILFDANSNPVKQHSVAAVAVILTDASTSDAKLIVWPLKQTNNLEINFGLMAAGDTLNRYVNVEAYINAGGPVECQVAVKSADDSLGTVAVVGPKVYGEKVDIVPQPVEGYHFTNWSDGRRANPRTVLILHDTAFASANFEINTYNIKATAENGIVEISGEQNEDNTFNHGTEIELTAIADEHYHFIGWTDGEAAAERKFKIVSDTTFEAAFAIDSFSISTLAENGTVTGAGRYPYGTEIELVAIADTLAGYHFANWSDGDNTNPRKIKVQNDMDLTAQFAINTYTIAYKLDDEVYGDIEVVAYNEPIALREAPQKEGYTFSGWSKIPATMPMGNVTVTGSFAINHHTITYMVDGDVYKKFENIPYASELSVIDNPEDKEGFTFSEWSELPVTMPDEDVVVTGSFIINEYEIAFVDFDGKVLQSGNVKYGQTPEYVGENPAQAATAQYTFKFNGWMPETKPVNGPQTYTAVYDTTVNQYAVSVVAENGSVKATTADGNEIENGKKVDYNTEVTLTATSPVSGYYFIRWSDGVTDNPRKFNIVKDTAFTAVYKKDFTADGLKYILTSASTVSVGKIDDDNKPTGELTIPATVKDGDGIQYYVTKVESYAFDECKDLTEVIISEGVMRIDYNAFYDCSSLTSVTIPNSVTSIGEEAFYYCHKLKSVTIPNSVTSIGQKAFCACDSLTSANIPANVTSVGYGAFGSCDKLERIYVDAENANYISLDGVLYSKDTTQLVQYPQGKQDTLYVVHDSVKTISQNAFLSCMNLKYVAIPYGVTKIEMYSFYNCWKLKTTLPSSCVSVGSRAFYNTGDSDNSGQTVYCQAENAPSTSTEKAGKARFVYENCKAIKLVSANNELGTATFATPGGMGADGSTWFAKDSTIILKANPVSGYELESFKVGETVIEPTNGVYKYKVTADATITATWKKSSLTLTYEPNGGSLSVEATQTIDNTSTITTLSADKISRQGYIFGGWNTKADGTGEYVTQINNPTDNITLYAQWEQTTFYVASGGTGNGTSPENALASLGDACLKMNKSNIKYTFVVCGTLTGNQMISPQIIDGHQYSISASSLTLCGLTSDAKIEANSTGSALSIGQVSFPITIANLTISGGYASYGGGIGYFNTTEGTLTLAEGAVITGNTAIGDGGGIYLQNSGISLDIKGGTISGNTASGEGGGVFFGDGNGSFTMSSGTISGNTAGGNGGGVYTRRALTMTGGQIVENTAQSGGAVYYGSYGNLIMSGNAEIPFGVNGEKSVGKNDVYIGSRVITIDGQLSNNNVATITPSSYARTDALLSGEAVTTEYTKFRVTPNGGTTWYINAEGKLFNGFVQVEGTYFDGTAVNESGVFIANRKFPIQSLLVSDHEVTQREYVAIMGSTVNPSSFSSDPADGEVQENRPVENVSWYAAIAYCNKRSKAEDLTPCYTVSGVTDWAGLSYSDIPTSSNETWNAVTCDFNANGYRLPTEAEWEYIARGGNLTNEGQTAYSGGSNVSEVAWYGVADGITHEVKKLKPNALGIYDMSGNVWEWCWDYYNTISSNTSATGPTSASSNYRSERGGWFGEADQYCYVNDREGNKPEYKDNRSGFRVVRTAVSSETCTVTIDKGTDQESYTVRKGYYVSAPAIPTRTGYIFEGWCSDEECETPYNFKAAVTGDVTLYAKWKKIYAKVGGTNYFDKGTTISAISDASEDVTIELYGGEGGVKAIDLGKTFSDGIIAAIQYIQSVIDVTLVVPAETPIVLSGEDCKDMFKSCTRLVAADLRGFNTVNVTNMASMFEECNNLASLDLSGFNTSSVSDMRWMFQGCSALTSLDLSSFNTSNVTTMMNMFAGCTSLIALDLNSFNTSKVSNMSAMFWNCANIETINLDNFNTGKVTDMNSMFMVCSKLTSIDVSGFNTSKVEYMDNMFAYCDVLTTIYAATGANWKTSVLISSTDMFLNSGSLPNYSDSHIDATYARINGGATNIGYFTDATTCYYINNYSGNNNNSGLTATTPLATLDGALSKMQNATPHYKFYIDGQLQGPLTIGSECDGKAKTITLCGMNDESWLSGGSTGSVLTISTTVPVTITNLTINGGTNTSGNGGGINMASGTKVTLGSGAIVSDNRAAKGGGIYSEGTLVLESGSVVGMADATTHATNSSYSNYATTGGGIDFAGGTVTIKEGAKVAYNFAYQGGGVHYSNEQYKPDDVLTISGGEIAYNGCDPKLYRSDHEHSWNSYGGGVFADGCTFNFSLGDIHHNFGCDGGGGLFLQKNTESAVISGGNIYDNTMHAQGSNEGSDILLFDACTLSMSGGNVYSSVANARGVYVRNTSTNLNVSGDAQLSANTPVYLTEGTKVTIAGKLTNNKVATITPAVYDGETQYIQLADGVTDTRLAFEYSKFSITPNGQEPWYLWDNGIISNWIIQVKEENDAEHPFVLYEDQNFKKLDDRGSGEMISAGFPEVYVGNAEQVTADRTYYITMRRYHRISPKYNGAFQLFNYNPNTTFTFHITLEGENTIERYKDTYESRAFEIKGSGSTSKIVLIFDANTSGTLTLNGYRDFEVNDNVQVEYQMADGCTFSGTADDQTFTNITDFFNQIIKTSHKSNCSFTITK